MRRLIPFLALAVLSCQSLDVTNPNLPDLVARGRA